MKPINSDKLSTRPGGASCNETQQLNHWGKNRASRSNHSTRPKPSSQTAVGRTASRSRTCRDFWGWDLWWTCRETTKTQQSTVLGESGDGLWLSYARRWLFKIKAIKIQKTVSIFVYFQLVLKTQDEHATSFNNETQPLRKHEINHRHQLLNILFINCSK